MPNSSEIMLEAIRLASENVTLGRGGPFAAIVARDGDILARGVNIVTSSNDPTAHAEVVAIRTACQTLQTFDLHGCEIYSSCEPCPMCMGAIYWARLSRVYYANTREDAARAGFDDSFIYREIARPIAERQIPMTRLLGDEALASFRAWDLSQNKTPY